MRLSSTGRVVLLILAVAGLGTFAEGAPIPSRAGDGDALDRGGEVRDELRALLAREDVARILAERGLTPEQAQERLAQLTAEDLASLSANPDQIQAAGNVPNYIWILLAILIGVTILATVF